MPLSFDYSLEELQNYQGCTPRPADFDAYWDAGLAEMRAVDPAVKLEPASFQSPFADCYDMTFSGVGGARVYAKLIRPKIDTPHPAVIKFHGYSGNSGDWCDILHYAAAGMTVVAMDCRGQGGRSADAGGVSGNTLNGHIIRGLSDAIDGAPEKLYFRQVFLDTAQLAGLVMAIDGVDATRVGVTGASQGGALTVACSALVPEIKLAASIYPFLADYQRVWEMDQAKDAYAELKQWFRRFDPLHKREVDVFTALGYVDIQHLAGRISAETHWYIGLSDTICPPSTQYAAWNKITAPKTMHTYPDYAHEALPGAGDTIFQHMLTL